VIVSCGIRPRDELAKQCGLEMGVRGGIKVDSGLKSSDDSIYAIGEVAAIDGKMCYGLWAPGVEQAEALAQKLLGKPEAPEYLASDLSTKLKLLGVEVASFGRSADFWFKGQYSGKDPSLKVIESKDDLNDTYRRLFFSADGSKLMGGILIGDAKDYSKLLQLSKKDDLAGNDPVALAFKLPPPGASSAVADGGDGTGMTDDDLICTCLALSKGQVRNAIIDMEAYTIPLIKKACKAGTGCGGCCTPVGEVPKLLAHTLKKLGKAGASGICSHFKYSRKELFDIVKVKELKSLEEILSAVGQGSPDGCELCKPVVASILSGLWNDHALKAGRDQIQEIQSPYHDKRQRINDKRNISMMRVYLAMTTSYCMISFESLNKYIYANYLTSCF
jgi:nitrite reductase (NADH) large subunit